MRSNHAAYFPALTGVRALAAYLVFIHHFNPIAPSAFPFLHHFLNEMHIGVSIFFVLSGFLISERYGSTVNDPRKFAHYLKKRVARIYPLYFILTTVTFFFLWQQSAFSSFSAMDYFMNISLLKGFSSEFLFSGIAQGWSLTVEECFYLLAPFIFWFGKRFPWWLIPLTLIGSGLLITLIANSFSFPRLFEDASFFMIYTFAGRCFEFLIGYLLAQKFHKPFPTPQLTFLGFVVIATCVTAMTFISLDHASSLDSPWGLALNNFILPICVAIFLAGLLNEKTWLSRCLSHPIAQLLGKSSFAFYLIHLGVLQQLTSAWITENIVLLFLFINALAIGLYLAVEKPIYHYLKAHWILAKQQQAPGA